MTPSHDQSQDMRTPQIVAISGHRRSVNAERPPLVSIVVTCKGRLHHLRETFDSFVGQTCAYPFELIVVDYGCPQSTFKFVRQRDIRGVVSARVQDDVAEFNLARARNCGACLAAGQVLAFVDADIRVSDGWLELVSTAILKHGSELMCTSSSLDGRYDRCGTCAVSRSMFEAVRGYDENLQGWGCEDRDFYERCGVRSKGNFYAAGWLRPIQHDDRDRVLYYRDKSIALSSRANATKVRARCGHTNPTGYGKGDFAVHAGDVPLTGNLQAAPRRIRMPIRSGLATNDRPGASQPHALCSLRKG